MHFREHLHKLGVLAVTVMALGLMGAAESCAKMHADYGEAFKSRFIAPELSANSDRRVVIYRMPMIAGGRPSFLDVEAILVDYEIDWAVEQLTKLDPHFIVSKPDASGRDDDVHHRVSDILWDGRLSRQEKVSRIIEEILVPARADLLLAGFVLPRPEGVHDVLVVVVLRHVKALISERWSVSAAEMSCTEGTRVRICEETRKRILDDIHDTLSVRFSNAGRL